MEKYLKRLSTLKMGSSSKKHCVEINLADLPTDPGLRTRIWDYHPNVREQVRREYALKGPCQPREHNFRVLPCGDKLRRFNHAWFNRYSTWLEYSIKNEAVYCLCCYLFKPDNGKQGGGDSFVGEGLSFAPVNGGGFWKYDSSREKKKKKSREGEDVAVVSHDVSISRAEPSGYSMQVQSSGNLMEAGQKENLQSKLGSMSTDSGTQQQMEEVEVLMSNGTERGVFNAEKEFGGEKCVQVGPDVGPVEEGQMLYCPSLTKPVFKEVSGCDPAASGIQFRRLKVGGNRVLDQNVEVKGSSGNLSVLQRGKWKIKEVASIVGLDNNKSRRIGVCWNEKERDREGMGSTGVTSDLGLLVAFETFEANGSAGRPSSAHRVQ
ncbi:hypothetical protein LWI29_029572 [Acer saccharum]|uniref:TTF-type domain-containing protein n=1 Tax=Acer saccharum TaxID=4024 RepID=A0AA39SPA2_ACESA|nr:hypothetical protein LWI29_029572 [Acer saccharum]